MNNNNNDNILNSLMQNMNNNFNMEMNAKIQEDKKDEKPEVTFTGNQDLLEKHIAIWDLILEIEFSIDNKVLIKNLTRRLILVLHEQIVLCNNNFDIFILNNLNKGYSKFLKIFGIVMIFITFLVTDFNYENNVKQNLRRIIYGLNDFLIWLIDNHILNSEEGKVGSTFIEKFRRSQKNNHKFKKGRDNASNMIKGLETVINTIKQFSKYISHNIVTTLSLAILNQYTL
jgi:hypothetical protein